MYKEFFGLRANPFNVNPDPRYLFLTRHTEEALACLTYGIQSRKGFGLLTGEVGTDRAGGAAGARNETPDAAVAPAATARDVAGENTAADPGRDESLRAAATADCGVG